MKKIYWLGQISPSEKHLVGQKAYELNCLVNQGFPVIPGFVIPATMTSELLLNQKIEPTSFHPDNPLYIDVDNPQLLQSIANHQQQIILNATIFPEWVTLILEAFNTYWPDQPLILRPTIDIEPVANIHPPDNHHILPEGIWESQYCLPTAISLTKGLKKVWSELFRARSLFYCQKKDLQISQIHYAILVQPLFEAIASGIIIHHPNQIEIHATKGQGLALKLGANHDTYWINPQTNTITKQIPEKTIAYRLTPNSTNRTTSNLLETQYLNETEQKQPVLTDETPFIELVNRLIPELGNNFQIEWILNHDQIYLTQINRHIPPLEINIQGLSTSPKTAIGRAYIITNNTDPNHPIPPNQILISKIITPDWIPHIKQAIGLITEQGGLTGHTAILAREIGIPAITGVPNATQIFKTGDLLQITPNGEIKQLDNNIVEPIILPNPINPKTLPIIGTKLLVNLSQTNLLDQITQYPIEGIGLLRSELMLIEILAGSSPQDWINQQKTSQLKQLWKKQLKQFLTKFSPRPVYYRSLDWRLSEFGTTKTKQTHTPLGPRGVYSYIVDSTLFDLELNILSELVTEGHHNLNLLLPFVRTLEEFTFCHQKIKQTPLLTIPSFQLWIMAEVPSVLFQLPQYVSAGCQGISIGTNDLTQLFLAVDRDSTELAKTYNVHHPSVIQYIEQLIKLAKTLNIPVSICGQAPVQYPDLIEQLITWGITSISVEYPSLETTAIEIAKAEQRILLKKHLG